MLSGFIDMPPYVTRVAPGASDLATAAEDAPPTQFRPSFGLGKSAEAAAKHITLLAVGPCGASFPRERGGG